ncbi:Formiminotetrahydrofolate cyclodeaminase [Amycolatopsis marina]|uniref:Formiminotetrahydrofolate cyclodeaminase n=1 Tax=Amycolatopsis marina TaxID=490629 RepID=A0A1I0ZTK8_9PSEU|nr:cyclodeaminase/cyclohydrolase family protein [Amycolatopsis marina]SFB28692.1 Formiminotetrahydrofolate cyclodeaminase [Amycolatopsis marina]
MASENGGLRDFLAEVAAPTPAWSAGGVAAVTTAAAAGLVAMSARLSVELHDAGERVAEAEALAARAMELAAEDATAYREVLTAQRASAAGDVTAALARAARPPLELARIGERVARMAESLAVLGKPVTRGDVVAAALLAAGAARSAAVLVRINLTAAHCPDDDAIEQARKAATAADDVARAAAGP